MRFIWAMVGLLGLSLVSCDKVFDVHPYDVNIKGEKNVNAKQIVKIDSRQHLKNFMTSGTSNTR